MFERFRAPKPQQTVEEVTPTTPTKPVSIGPVVAIIDPARRMSDRMTALKVRFHGAILEKLNLSAIDKVPADELQKVVSEIVGELLVEEKIALSAGECIKLIEEIMDEVLGLGPLEPLLKDNSISDILVNGFDLIYIERRGQLEETDVKFKDNDHLRRIIDKIISRVGRRIDESRPWVDARLADGSRINAIIPPCALDGPALSIRKFSEMPYTVDSLVENNSLSPDMAAFLQKVVKARLNILISGGTGSGKTTFLNALSRYISDKERLVTIEDSAELQMQQKHVIRLETKTPNVEGVGEVSQRDLVKNALRMRPDRIIIGEVRGIEVLDMLQAMNTGHDGSMSTIHANTPRDAFSRIEQMLGMAGSTFTETTMRAQMSSALHVVVQLSRLADGKRKVTSVQEVTGMEGNIITMQEIFKFVRTGVGENGETLGHFESTGLRPKAADKFAEFGLDDNTNYTSNVSR